MHELTRVVIRSGLIPEETLHEFRKWGLMTPDILPPPSPSDPEQLVMQLDRALQEEDLVIIRETDLEALNSYLSTMTPSKIHVVMPDGTMGDFEVSYGRLKTGEFIFPWHHDTIEEVLVNGETYLIENLEKESKVFFSSVRELFFGDHKAFVVCTPSTREVSNGPHEQLGNAPSE